MVLELLKNSARATIETSSSPAEVEARPPLGMNLATLFCDYSIIQALAK